jgi:hypothetical protein
VRTMRSTGLKRRGAIAKLEQRIIKGESLQSDESHLFAGPEAGRPDDHDSRGRVVLKFRVGEETRRYYRWLERMYLRHGPRAGGFFSLYLRVVHRSVARVLQGATRVRGDLRARSVSVREPGLLSTRLYAASPRFPVARWRRLTGERRVALRVVSPRRGPPRHAPRRGFRVGDALASRRNGHTVVQHRRRVRVGDGAKPA